MNIALLTGGWDRPYAYGMGTALGNEGIHVDFIAGEDFTPEDFAATPTVRTLIFKPPLHEGAGRLARMLRVLAYYRRLVSYAWSAQPRIFHILWNNGYDTFDRVVLMTYYKLLRKRIILTAHNVNAGRRDANDTLLNRFTLRFQYRLCDHIFVHTEQMKRELVEGFRIAPASVTVVPFGINNSVPDTAMTQAEARERLGLAAGQKVVLFFGNIAPYKGLEYLVDAFLQVAPEDEQYRLIVAGQRKPRSDDEYWDRIVSDIGDDPCRRGILLKIQYIPDAEAEIYFKAADVLVLPYTHIFQSGVLFLGFSFGLPALVADVGSLKDEVVEGRNGFVFAPRDAADLARSLRRYFSSDLYRELAARRGCIREEAVRAHSWTTVAEMTRGVYRSTAVS